MSVKITSIALLFAALPVTAFAVDLQVEQSAAQITARSASRNVFQLDDIHKRMHSAINCLVGPKGDGFDATAPNPCAATGNGVIPDTSDAAKKTGYQAAVDKLKAGLAIDDRAAAMQTALDAADMIVAVNTQ